MGLLDLTAMDPGQRKIMGMMALQDAFGTLGSIGSGLPYQSRAIPLMMAGMQQQQEAKQTEAEKQRARATMMSMGILQGGPPPTPMSGLPQVSPLPHSGVREPSRPLHTSATPGPVGVEVLPPIGAPNVRPSAPPTQGTGETFQGSRPTPQAAAAGIPPEFKTPAFQAYAQAYPQDAMKMVMDHQAAAAGRVNKPFDNYRVVGDDLMAIGPDGKPVVAYEGGRDIGGRPNSPIAKLAEDFRAGRIDRPTYDAARTKLLASGGERISFDANGNPVIERGGAVGQNFGRKPTNDLQDRYAGSYDLHSRMDRIGEIAEINPDTGRMSEKAARMLTYRGQGEDWLATIAEKAGVEPSETAREAIQLRTKFTTSVEQLFNAYRKEITGAAAAVQELERLKKSFLNTDMSPTQFEAAYGEYRRELQRAMRVSSKLLREGVDLKSKAGGDVMDRMFLGGGDDSPNDRFDELIGQGMSQEDAYAKLAREGYS